jgi:2-dehydropantoate 2-reductase
MTGMECRWYAGTNAAARVKWSKLMLNIGFNALNAVTGMTSAELLADPVRGKLAITALREGFAAMKALRLEPVDLPGFPVSKLRFLVQLPVRVARAVLSWQAKQRPEAAFSMRQDVQKNRQHTEIQELNGVIAAMGKRFGFDSSANEELIRLLHFFR